MIKKIICPTDFSKSAVNAAEYAAKLAQSFAAELLFVNVQKIVPVAAAVSLGDGIGANVRENAQMAAGSLKEMSIETNKMFNISTDYEVDITTKPLEKVFSSIKPENTMIVMGTNGADSISQYFFGTNTYHVIQKSNCPLLLIPENVSFGSIKKIVFAWDYSKKSKFSFSLLNDFMETFNPYFIFLHISKKHTEISHEVFKALRSEIESVLGEKCKVEFEQLFSENIPESINNYMLKSQADMLSINYYNRGLIPDIFHGTVVKELSETAEYPILVLHA